MATPGKGTPGRRKTLKSNNQYFDVGKVGRKTGVTLRDTGVRDEHGMEPIAGVFSSPLKESPARGNKIITSSAMDLQESSAPDVDETLHLRKTPRLPPPRATTPRHTNIGSPKRASSARPTSRANNEPFEGETSPVQTRTQPPPNRVLDFGAQNEEASKVHTSIEGLSPFKPKKSLRRSNGPVRRDLFASPEKAAHASDALPTLSGIQAETAEEEDAPLSVERPGHGGGLEIDDYQPMPVMEEEEDDAGATSADEVPATPSKGSPNRSRLSADNSGSGSRRQSSVSSRHESNRKRDRGSLEREEAADSGVSLTEVRSEAAHPAQKKKRISTGSPAQEEDHSQVVDPSLTTQDGYLATIPEDDDVEPEQPRPKKKGKGGRPTKKTKPPPANRRTNSVPVTDSPSKLRQSPSKRGSSMGPVSNVNLRSTTPFEDAGQRVSRYGRPVMQPLKHWANEHMIYKHGEIEGIVRADEVEKLQPQKAKRKAGPKNKTRKTNASRLDDAEGDESGTESILPDEWEQELGVISGEVPSWDPQTQQTDANNLVKEDLGFASSSIVTKEVSGSDFRFAKILNLPFFGSGMVELPPEGFKRAKNSRKMQMVFFVHEGKCLVDVGGNEFAVAKGGVWVVPRGNNYAITNESRSMTAKVFFAQGCVEDGSA
ncbi:hypothetical protein MBLNU230_g6471t1 [Neophaeotheca triangularis]